MNGVATTGSPPCGGCRSGHHIFTIRHGRAAAALHEHVWLLQLLQPELQMRDYVPRLAMQTQLTRARTRSPSVNSSAKGPAGCTVAARRVSRGCSMTVMVQWHGHAREFSDSELALVVSQSREQLSSPSAGDRWIAEPQHCSVCMMTALSRSCSATPHSVQVMKTSAHVPAHNSRSGDKAC